MMISPIKKSEGLNIWNHFVNPVVVMRAARAPVKGQGLLSTRWYG